MLVRCEPANQQAVSRVSPPAPDPPQRARKGNPRAVKELAWAKRLDMLRDVAAGMHYLHTRRPPVIHGDLRSPNLLLDLTIDRDRPRFHVKIADFGLARWVAHWCGQGQERQEEFTKPAEGKGEHNF